MKKDNDTSAISAVFYEAFEEEEQLLINYLPQKHKYLFTDKTIQETQHELPPALIISTRTQSQIPLNWAGRISALITRSTGYDHISKFLTETQTDIPAAYLPDYAGRAVAEQAMLMWTALLRKFDIQKKSFKTFNRNGLTGREVLNRTIAIIGGGRIGSQIANIAHGLGMNLLGVDIKPNFEFAEKCDLKYVSLDDALKDAEIVVCALPLTDLTDKMLNHSCLSQVPPKFIIHK